jgi:hypothetical protein
MKFSDLQFCRHPTQDTGVQAEHTFPNGFTVSVVKCPNSIGWLDGLYEMAILNSSRNLAATCFGRVMLGHLTIADVEAFLAQVELLDADGCLPEGVAVYEQVGVQSEQAERENDIILGLSGSMEDRVAQLLGMITAFNGDVSDDDDASGSASGLRRRRVATSEQPRSQT